MLLTQRRKAERRSKRESGFFVDLFLPTLLVNILLLLRNLREDTNMSTHSSPARDDFWTYVSGDSANIQSSSSIVRVPVPRLAYDRRDLETLGTFHLHKAGSSLLVAK